MIIGIKNQFMENWGKFFPGAELPIIFYYTNEEGHGERAQKPDVWKCVICDLGRVRKGKSVYFNIDAVSCGGGKRYFGFSDDIMPDFEYFLSCGIPGKVEGERYKKTPELVRQIMKHQPTFEAPGKYIVFKRWDQLEENDQPLATIFFARPDVLAGLFALANFDEASPNAVIAPFCSGCSSIVSYPFMELKSDHPRAILGMFDPSARPCVPSDTLTFSIPWPKFVTMVDNFGESHMITDTWDNIRERISRR